eukprot:gene1433-32806_t
MFEGILTEAVLAACGKFVDVQKDALKISLWGGQGVLENVKLRPEAFEYLQLPFSVSEGCIGKLRLQIPWGRWVTGNLIIELSDVTLCTTSREDDEWEEGPALERDQAAKQAELAAAELAKLSRRMAQHKAAKGRRGSLDTAYGAGGQSGSIWSPFRYMVQQLTSFLLNRLLLTVSNVHVMFKPGLLLTVSNVHILFKAPKPDGSSTVLGMKLHKLATVPVSSQSGLSSTLFRMFGGSVLQKGRHLKVEQLQAYIHCIPAPSTSSRPHAPHPGPTASRPQDLGHLVNVAPLCPEPEESDLILKPVDLAVQVIMGGSGGAGIQHQLEVLLGIEQIHFQAKPQQVHATSKLSDDFNVWNRRNRCGRFRPRGWRTKCERVTGSDAVHAPDTPPGSVPMRAVWKYAILSVLYDIRRKRIRDHSPRESTTRGSSSNAGSSMQGSPVDVQLRPGGGSSSQGKPAPSDLEIGHEGGDQVAKQLQRLEADLEEGGSADFAKLSPRDPLPGVISLGGGSGVHVTDKVTCKGSDDRRDLELSFFGSSGLSQSTAAKSESTESIATFRELERFATAAFEFESGDQVPGSGSGSEFAKNSGIVCAEADGRDSAASELESGDRTHASGSASDLAVISSGVYGEAVSGDSDMVMAEGSEDEEAGSASELAGISGHLHGEAVSRDLQTVMAEGSEEGDEDEGEEGDEDGDEDGDEEGGSASESVSGLYAGSEYSDGTHTSSDSSLQGADPEGNHSWVAWGWHGVSSFFYGQAGTSAPVTGERAPAGAAAAVPASLSLQDVDELYHLLEERAHQHQQHSQRHHRRSTDGFALGDTELESAPASVKLQLSVADMHFSLNSDAASLVLLCSSIMDLLLKPNGTGLVELSVNSIQAFDHCSESDELLSIMAGGAGRPLLKLSQSSQTLDRRVRNPSSSGVHPSSRTISHENLSQSLGRLRSHQSLNERDMLSWHAGPPATPVPLASSLHTKSVPQDRSSTSVLLSEDRLDIPTKTAVVPFIALKMSIPGNCAANPEQSPPRARVSVDVTPIYFTFRPKCLATVEAALKGIKVGNTLQGIGVAATFKGIKVGTTLQLPLPALHCAKPPVLTRIRCQASPAAEG